jgi:hypothetical protein
MTKLLTEFDLQDPMVVADKIAPVVGERVGDFFGNAAALVDGLKGAGQLLLSGDGISIATSMAGFIKAFTGWLRNKSEENAEQTWLNRRLHQTVFMQDTPIAWMTRKNVGATRALGSVVLKAKPFVKMSNMLKQFAPGAVFSFERVGYDVLRRSFSRTDAPNAFDEGQPDIFAAIKALPESQADMLQCMSNTAALAGRGCCCYPGEEIQFSFGTYPYLQGFSVISGQSYVDPEIPLVRHAALMAPSAHHVLIDEADVYRAYMHWSNYARLKEIPPIGEGQKDPGIYIDKQGLPQEIGGTQYWWVGSGDFKGQAPGARLRDITASFFQFFVVRQMVLRQFKWLAPSVKEAARDSKDERIRKLARGESVPLWKWDPFDPLLQLEQLSDGPNHGGGFSVKDAPPKPDPDKGPDKGPAKTEKQTEAAPEPSRGIPWIDVGAVLAGVGGAAYVARRDIVRWVREKVR